MQLSCKNSSFSGALNLGMEGMLTIRLCAKRKLLRLESSLQNKCSGNDVSSLFEACSFVRSEHPQSHCGSEVNLLCETSISAKFMGGTVVVKVSSSRIEQF